MGLGVQTSLMPQRYIQKLCQAVYGFANGSEGHSFTAAILGSDIRHSHSIHLIFYKPGEMHPLSLLTGKEAGGSHS